MTNYGSNIKLTEAGKSRGKGRTYRWIAHANLEYLDTVFLNKHEEWTKKPLNYVVKKVGTVIPHECIHCILWDLGEDPHGGYDVVRGKLIHKRKNSRYIRNIYYSMT